MDFRHLDLDLSILVNNFKISWKVMKLFLYMPQLNDGVVLNKIKLNVMNDCVSRKRDDILISVKSRIGIVRFRYQSLVQ